MFNEELRLKDFEDVLRIDVLKEQNPHMVIVGTRCEACGALHPFLFTGETLYYMQTYFTWNQRRECGCGEDIGVCSGIGDVIFNPHNLMVK